MGRERLHLQWRDAAESRSVYRALARCILTLSFHCPFFPPRRFVVKADRRPQLFCLSGHLACFPHASARESTPPSSVDLPLTPEWSQLGESAAASLLTLVEGEKRNCALHEIRDAERTKKKKRGRGKVWEGREMGEWQRAVVRSTGLVAVICSELCRC